MNSEKIITKEQFVAIRQKLAKEGKTVVQCHGVFDLIHPGHIIHLQEAKKIGDVLVISITAERYVQKGPGRPFFNDELRMLSLSALDVVDYVILSEAVTALNIIDIIRPDVYVKGSEYEISENDLTENIDAEAERVIFYGGEIVFTQGDVFSSTKLLNNIYGALPKNVIEQSKKINKTYSISNIKSYVDSFSNIKVLVIGDVIIDEYIFCNLQGIMSKDQAFSTRYVKSEKYLGGVLAVAKHLAAFSNNVTLFTMVGNEENIHSNILDSLDKQMVLDLELNSGYKTIIKKKFIQKNEMREEYNKIFSINHLQEHNELKSIDMTNFYNRLAEKIKDFDMVVVCDFGHGVIDGKVMDIVQSAGKFVCVNCQTNSSNYGFNIITKYTKINSFTLDEKEITLAFKDSITDRDKLLYKLKHKLKADYCWLTLGANGGLGIDINDKISNCAALTLSVKDTIGAGDAFYSVVCLCAYANVPIEISTLLGNAAGAIIANVLGNSQSLEKAKLLKYVSTVLNV